MKRVKDAFRTILDRIDDFGYQEAGYDYLDDEMRRLQDSLHCARWRLTGGKGANLPGSRGTEHVMAFELCVIVLEIMSDSGRRKTAVGRNTQVAKFVEQAMRRMGWAIERETIANVYADWRKRMAG